MSLNAFTFCCESSPLSLAEAHIRDFVYAFHIYLSVKLSGLWVGWGSHPNQKQMKKKKALHPVGSLLYCDSVSISTGTSKIPILTICGAMRDRIQSVTEENMGELECSVGTFSIEASQRIFSCIELVVMYFSESCKSTLSSVDIASLAPQRYLPQIVITRDGLEGSVVVGIRVASFVKSVMVSVGHDLHSYGATGAQSGLGFVLRNIRTNYSCCSNESSVVMENITVFRILPRAFELDAITMETICSPDSMCSVILLGMSEVKIDATQTPSFFNMCVKARSLSASYGVVAHYFFHELFKTLLGIKKKAEDVIQSVSSIQNSRGDKDRCIKGRKHFQLSLSVDESDVIFKTVGETVLKLRLNRLNASARRLSSKNVLHFTDIQTASILFGETRIAHITELKLSNYDQEFSSCSKDYLRKDSAYWDSKEGKLMLLHFDRLDFELHYMYRFDIHLNNIQNSIKSLKALYKGNIISKVEKGCKPSVFSGLLIRCRCLNLRFLDSDFDYALQKIHEMKSEEAIERELRFRDLEEKLEGIRSNIGTGIAGFDCSEIYDALNRENSRIYCERMKNLHDCTPPQRALFNLSFIESTAFFWRDPSICQYDSLLKLMEDVDPQNPIPKDCEFNLLLGRRMSINSSLIFIQLRDYPQPFVNFKNVHWSGTFVVAESYPHESAIRHCKVDLERDQDRYLFVKRSMPPVKFYPDFGISCESCGVSWGPCYEPVLSEVSDAFSFLSKKSIDPSPFLPFFDKFRVLFHSRLEVSVIKFTLSLLATRSPYNITEKLQCTMEQLDMLWYNSKIIFETLKTEFIIRTASAHDKKSIWSFPDCRLVYQFVWQCPENNNHHHVMPINPECLLKEEKESHDSFKNVRSSSVHLLITMESRLFPFGNSIRSKDDFENLKTEQSAESTQTSQTPNCTCKLFLYANTLTWLKKMAAVYSGNSLPIRRGSLDGISLLPKFSKPKFGRHINKLNFRFSFPSVNARYWTSPTKLEGLEVISGELKFLMDFDISLKPYGDNLFRRSKKVWSSKEMVVDLSRLSIGVFEEEMQDVGVAVLGDNFKDGRFQLDVDDIETFHVLSCHHLYYYKFKDEEPKKHSSSYDSKDTEKKFVNSQYQDVSCAHNLLVFDVKGTWNDITGRTVTSISEVYKNWSALNKYLSANPEIDPTFSFANAPGDAKQKGRPTLRPKKSLLKKESLLSNPMLNDLILQMKGKKEGFIARSEDMEETSFNVEEEQSMTKSTTDVILFEDFGDIVRGDFTIDIYRGQVLISADRGGYGSAVGKIIVSSAKTNVRRCLLRPIVDKSKETVFMKRATLGELFQLQILVGSSCSDIIEEEDLSWLPRELIVSDDKENIEKLLKDLEMIRVCEHFGCRFSNVSFKSDIEITDLEDLEPFVRTRLDEEEFVDSLNLEADCLKLKSNSKEDSIVFNVLCALLLKTAPERKERKNELETVKYSLKLSQTDDFSQVISYFQHHLKALLQKISMCENTCHLLASKHSVMSSEKKKQLENTNSALNYLKELKSQYLRDLSLFVEGVKWFLSDKRSAVKKGPVPEKIVHILLREANWTLMSDNNDPITDLHFSNFSFSLTNFSDESSIQKLELGTIELNNRLPGTAYKEVLKPYEGGKGGLSSNAFDRDVLLRVFVRKTPAVGGIQVMEHFEVNIVPLTVKITQQLYTELFNYYFPPLSSSTDANENSLPMLERCLELENEMLREINLKVAMCEAEPDSTLTHLRDEQVNRVKELKESIALCIVQSRMKCESEDVLGKSSIENTSKHRRNRSQSNPARDNPLPFDHMTSVVPTHRRLRSSLRIKVNPDIEITSESHGSLENSSLERSIEATDDFSYSHGEALACAIAEEASLGDSFTPIVRSPHLPSSRTSSATVQGKVLPETIPTCRRKRDGNIWNVVLCHMHQNLWKKLVAKEEQGGCL